MRTLNFRNIIYFCAIICLSIAFLYQCYVAFIRYLVKNTSYHVTFKVNYANMNPFVKLYSQKEQRTQLIYKDYFRSFVLMLKNNSILFRMRRVSSIHQCLSVKDMDLMIKR